MRINAMIGSGRIVIILLVLICAGIGGLLFKIPSDSYRFLGTCLIAVGIFNALLHKTFGRQTYEWAHSMPKFVTGFWDTIGKEGAQFLYLGIGVILIVAGVVLLIKSL
jgi:hypothetical protein